MTTEIRLALATAKAQVREYLSDIEILKLGIRDHLLITSDGDVKKLGANEAARSDTYERAYLQNGALQDCIRGLRVAQDTVDRLTATLEGTLDDLKAERAAVDARRTDAIFAVIDVLRGDLSPAERAVANGALVSAGAA